jgi:hypothetical protein
VTGQPTTHSLKQVRNAATLALKEGRLHPYHWAEVDDLLLDERLEEAAQLLAQHITSEPAYPAVPGRGNSPMPGQQTTERRHVDMQTCRHAGVLTG